MLLKIEIHVIWMPLNLGEIKFFSIQLCSTVYFYLCFRSNRPIRMLQGSALVLLYFSWEISPHPIHITVIQHLKTIFANIQYVYFVILIKFHFKLFLLLFAQQFQMRDEIFLKYCAADVVTREKVKYGQENKSRELWRVNCFPSFSVYLLCYVMQVPQPC